MNKPQLYIGNKTFSAHSLRPWLLLKMHEVEFEEIAIRLYEPDSIEQVALVSPSLQLPALLHGEIRAWDSLAICEYLSETFLESRGWPSDTRRRTAARSIVAECHSDFATLRQEWPMNCQLRYPQPVTRQLEREIARLEAIMYCCRHHYGNGGDFLFGRFSIADCFMAPYCITLDAYGAQLGSKAREYLDMLLAQPAIAEWLEDAAQEMPYEGVMLNAG